MTSRPHTPPSDSVDERLSALSPAKRAFVEAALRARQNARVDSTIPRRDGGSAPVSFAQELLWHFEQSLPGTSTYNVPRAFRVYGELDATRLSRALDAVVARHEMLRTVIDGTSNPPAQIVRPTARVPLTTVDLTAEPTDRESRALALLRDAASMPFDLTRDVLLRATLVRLTDNDSLLLLVSHHIASDGASGDVFLRDLAAYYDGNDLPPLAVQYGDFAAWQRRELTPARRGALLEYWRARLAGATSMLELPVSGPRPAAPSFRGARRTALLPRRVADAVVRASAAMGTTPFMFLLACTHALLAKYTRQDDIIIGTVLTRREWPELEPLIGYFSNVLPVRAVFDDNTPFSDVLACVRGASLDLNDHADLPFESLALDLRDGSVAAGAPLFQVMFSMLPGEDVTLSIGDARLTPLQLDRGIAKFELTFATGITADGLRVAIEYATDLFDADCVDRMLGHFARLVEAAAARPDTPVGELPILGDAERDLVVRAWNATSVAWPADATLASLLAAQAERSPRATAVVCGAAELSYADLHARAATLARCLAHHGVGAGDLVGVCMERSLDMVVALCAIIAAGAAYVPLDPDLPSERLAFMASDASVRVLLTQANLGEVVPGHAGVSIAIDTEWAIVEALAAAAPPPRPPSPDDLAYMIYTSGSTGRPKGALNAHRGIVNRLLWMQREYTLTDGDVVLQKTPFSFDVSVWEFFWPLLTGARLVMAAPGGHRDPGYLVETIVEHGVTITHFVPSMLRAFLDADGVERCTSLRDVMCSGEALPYELQQRYFARLGANLHNLYGPTEAAVDVTYWRCSPHDARRVVPIGRPVANTQMYVLDQRLRPVPIGMPGELHIGGVQVGNGYHNRPDLTAERFIRDPFDERESARLYRTGDLARWLPDGALEYLGRLDHQVKLRGFRIELGEIEAVLASHAAVADAVVVAREMRAGEPSLVSYYVARPGARASGAELRTHLRRELPEYMVPAAFVAMDAFPLTPSGKLDRKALPAPPELLDEATAYVPPRTDTEDVIARIWSDVLGRERIGVNDHFFAVGGHSLLAMRVVGRVRTELGVAVPFTRVFESPTIAALSRVVDELRGDNAQRATASGAPGAPVTRAPLTPVQRMLWTQEQMAPDRGMYHIRLAFTVAGEIDLRALQRALDAMVARHAVFRTTFIETDDGPEQVVRTHGDARIAEYELPPMVREAQQAAALAQLTHDALAPFDLADAPLLRTTVVRMGSGVGMLQFVAHHLVFDGWSVAIFLRELSAIYASECGGTHTTLEPMPMQFADWAAHTMQRAAQGDEGIVHWVRTLAGFSAAVLPRDGVTPADDGMAARIVVTVSPADTDAFFAACRGADATAFMGLVAALHVALAGETGASDVTLAAPIAARESADVAGMIGCFANTVALRGDLSGDPTLREALDRARRICLDAYAHGDVPLDEIMLRMASAHDRRTTLPVMLVLQDDTRDDYPLGDAVLTPLQLPAGRASFDLKLSVTRLTGGLRLAAEYRPSAVGAATVRRILDRVHAVLTSLAATPDARIGALSTLPVAAADGAVVAESGGGMAGGAAVSPATPVEQVIASVWRDVLGRDGIGVESDFLDVGGHSLLAIKVVGRLSKLFRTRLPVRMFFEHPTIRGFASALSARDDGANAARIAGALIAIQAMTPSERDARRAAHVERAARAADRMPS